ncbi:helix-turn-helix domain-containing protein (plasmid) [Streptomyces sp. BI20]|uniref:helix-turn-helix domain-containing protein n=1 Tax=Streptomyces sp. BI20 TaxID=3403460 RepID=UPI003C77121D
MPEKPLDPESSPQAAMGARLRSLRKARGLRQEDMAELTGYSPGHMSLVETGRKPFTLRLARALNSTFDLHDASEESFTRDFLAVRHSLLVEGLPDYQKHEAKAREIRINELGVIPGLVQTSAYTNAMAQGPVRRGVSTQAQADRWAKTILDRQEAIRRDPPLLMHVILDESCIQRRIGTAREWRDQLDVLLDFATLGHTVLQVTPFDLGTDRSLPVPVHILTMPDRSVISWSESAHQGHLERDDKAVSKLLAAYYQLQAASLSQRDSVAMIERLRKAVS